MVKFFGRGKGLGGRGKGPRSRGKGPGGKKGGRKPQASMKIGGIKDVLTHDTIVRMHAESISVLEIRIAEERNLSKRLALKIQLCNKEIDHGSARIAVLNSIAHTETSLDPKGLEQRVIKEMSETFAAMEKAKTDKDALLQRQKIRLRKNPRT